MEDMDLQDYGQFFESSSESSDDYISYSTYDSDSDVSLTSDQTKHLDDEPASANSPVCDTAPSDQTSFDGLEEAEESEKEEEPCSSQKKKDGIVVSACQKKDGGRVYNKKHYCLYCHKPYSKIARHLEGSHAKKPDVAKALSFPKGSKDRKRQLDYIRNRGNYAHNSAVMKSGKGELVPFKRPPKEAQANEFMHCVYCQGLFIRKVLWRHLRSCRLKPETDPPKRGKYRVQALCTYTGPAPSNMSKQLWGIVSSMNLDPITDIIKNDKVIIDFGQHLLNKGGVSAQNKQCVREKMRELGRLVQNARRVTTLKKMEDCVNPKKYMETIKAIKFTCGYDGETDKFLIPSLANKLGNSLVKVSRILKAQGLVSNRQEAVRNAIKFQDLHREKWNQMISATALRNIREAKSDVPTLLEFTEDVQKMHAFLGRVQDECFKTLSESPSAKAWTELAKVCLAHVIFFNRRREGHVESAPLTAFLARDASNPHEDVDWALSEVEKRFCGHSSRMVTRGMHGWPVPILLTPKMLCALELLAKHREACGVLKDNVYVFARPEAMTHLQGSDCLRGFAKACGATCPKSLKSARLRKQVATLATVMNMEDAEMEQLVNFLGHDIRAHSEKTSQLAKILKVLMALEQGRMAEFYGKRFDEVGIDHDEKVVVYQEEERGVQEGHCSSALHGKTAQKKNPWQQTEVQAVERHMMHFITSCTVPAKGDCERCLKAEPEALKNRDWKNLKFFIHNRITAYKRHMQYK